jgi:hypothetical protein
MRIVRDLDHVKQRKRIAKLSTLGGVLLFLSVLAATPFLNNNMTLIWVTYIPLFGGLILFQFGTQQLAKWGRSPRNDELIDSQLRSLGEKYVLVHYATLGKRTVEHMLIHPGGVLTLTARELPGKIGYDGRWRRLGGGFSRFFTRGGPQLGNPSADTDADVAAARGYLAEAQLEVEVDGAIVFLNPRVELEVEEPDYPVMNAEGLPGFVRALPVDPSLGPADRQALIGLLAKGEEVEQRQSVARRRPVKRRAA